MSTLTYQMYHGYHIGTDQPLSDRQLQQLRICFEKPPLPAVEVLAGRQGATIVHLENMGSVAVKHYARGGLIRHVNHCAYVNWPCTRGEKEFRWLATVRQLGLAVPRPIVFASTGRFVGQCWLVTAAIPRPYPLTRIGQQHDDQRKAIYGLLAKQIGTLIRHRIWHRDLHPGNILVDDNGTPHIIDFDKACYLKNRRRLTAKYRKRWTRAIAKYGLLPELEDVMKKATTTT
jgi:RIO-like serine/threonine protein kinase